MFFSIYFHQKFVEDVLLVRSTCLLQALLTSSFQNSAILGQILNTWALERRSSIKFSGASANSPQLFCDLFYRRFSSVSFLLLSFFFLLVDEAYSISPTLPVLTPLLVMYLIGKLDADVGLRHLVFLTSF